VIRRLSYVSSPAGFSLVETLVAALLMMVVSAAILQLLSPATAAFAIQPEAADQQQRLRVAVSALHSDLDQAGAGPYGGAAAAGLTDHLAAVLPYRTGSSSADPPGSFREDVVTLMFVPAPPAQSRIRRISFDPAGATLLELPPACGGVRQDARCGFDAGMRVLITEAGGRWNVGTVVRTDENVLQLVTQGPLSSTFEDGGVVVELRSRTYHLRRDVPAGVFQMMRYDGAETDLPVVDDVVRMEFRYWGAAEPPRLVTGLPADVRRTTYGPFPPPIGEPSGAGWPDGENCTFTITDGVHTPRLASLTPDASGLVELTAASFADGPWCPDPARVDRYDADLLRIRRIEVRLRTQAGSSRFRGPASSLFVSGGRAKPPYWLPDLEIRFDVAPRNLNLVR
jgi:type II secretory pathway pseudopilin PulG